MGLGEKLLGPALRAKVRNALKRWAPLVAVGLLGSSAILRALGYPEAADAVDAAAKAAGLDPESAHILGLAALFTAGAAALAGASAKVINLVREARGEPALPEPTLPGQMMGVDADVVAEALRRGTAAGHPQFLEFFNAMTAEGVPRDAAGRIARKVLGL